MALIHPSSFSHPFFAIAVVKVGGSLYDLPDLGPRLCRWLAEQCSGLRVVVVPGGGPIVDALRHLDRRHGLGEEASHWLALRALSVNAQFLASLLPDAEMCGDTGQLGRAWDNNRLAVLDVHEFAREDERHCGRLPHNWSAASDAFAARAAVVFQARHLALLKSTAIPQDMDWTEAGRRGFVDALFAEVLRDAPADLCIRAINLRTWQG